MQKPAKARRAVKITRKKTTKMKRKPYLPFVITDNSITVVSGRKTFTVTHDKSAFNAVKKRLEKGEFEGIESLLTGGNS